MPDSAPKRIALITGASSGIGRCFAERLARDGYDLVLVARDAARLAELAANLRENTGVGVEVMAADLTVPDERGRVEARAAGVPPIALLVNNAGMGTSGRFEALDIDVEEREIELNVIALVRLTHAVLPGMIARKRGAIINVSSVAAFQPGPYNATYNASKAFVSSFTEAIHEEVRGTSVRVQTLCPGFTRTEFQDRAGIDESKVPAAAWMEPEEVVEGSLRALRRGDAVYVPGIHNRALAATTSTMPRAMVRRIAGAVGRRVNDG
ncbi:MAG: SDR family oxidoreductase [Chloroflexi bacterium]|nr:SDR family oxidoreductase [Chloroflexota bacterium]